MLIAPRLKIDERRALPGGLAAVADAEPGEVRLQARDEVLIELPVVAELRAADDSLAAQADAGGEAAVRIEVWEPAGEGGGGAGVGEVGGLVGRPLESAAHADMHAVPGHMTRGRSQSRRRSLEDAGLGDFLFRLLLADLPAQRHAGLPDSRKLRAVQVLIDRNAAFQPDREPRIAEELAVDIGAAEDLDHLAAPVLRIGARQLAGLKPAGADDLALDVVVQADGRREPWQQSIADPAVQLLIIAPIVALGVDREWQAGAIRETPGPGLDRAGVENSGHHVESVGARLHAVEGPANVIASRRVHHGAAHIVIAAGRERHAEIDFDPVDLVLIGAPDDRRLRIEQAVRAGEAHAARDEIRRAIHRHEVGVLLLRAG